MCNYNYLANSFGIITVLSTSVRFARHRLSIWKSAAEVDRAPPEAVDFPQPQSVSVH